MADAAAEYVQLPIYREELSRALNFTEADLLENRAGRLSASQQFTQLRAVRRAGLRSAVHLVLAGACLAAWLTLGAARVLGLIPLILAGILLTAIGVFAWYAPARRRDARTGVVSSVEGLVRPAERETDAGAGYGRSIRLWTYYWVVDDRERFWVPGRVYPVPTPARHRLYFLPSSRRIVAAEPI